MSTNFTHLELTAIREALIGRLESARHFSADGTTYPDSQPYTSSLKKVELLLRPTMLDELEDLGNARRASVSAPEQVSPPISNDPIEW